MNRTTRLSLIAVMLLATTALGIIGYKAMYPDLPPPPPKEEPNHPPPQIVYPEPKEPLPNPEYIKLQVELKLHEQRCWQMGKETVIVLESKSQTNLNQRIQDCWNLVKIEREYATNFPAKTIQ